MNESLKRFFEEKRAEIVFLITLLTVVAAIANAYIFGKLAPFAARQDIFDTRVSALESEVDKNTIVANGVDVIRQQIIDIKQDVSEMKQDVKAILRGLD